MSNKEFDNDPHHGFNLLEQAVAGICPASVTPAFLQGMIGGSAHAPGIPLLASDVTHWLVPGIKWCGIQADLLALPALPAEGSALLQQQLRRSRGVPMFAFSAPLERHPPINAEPAAKNSKDNFGAVAALELDPMIIQQGLVTQAARSQFTVRDAAGAFRILSYAELSAKFSHLLLLRKSAHRGVKAAHREVALRTWALFARAYPERFLSSNNPANRHADSKEAMVLRALAADFWRQLAGSDRSAASQSLRRLGTSLENARTPLDMQAIADTLALLTRPQFLLPSLVENALSAPIHSVLSDSERRELIYLARAGTRDVKIFAAYRLGFERECADARSTLQQMRFDDDAWVRAAARL